jgi:disulfide bond formation protein DsbB
MTTPMRRSLQLLALVAVLAIFFAACSEETVDPITTAAPTGAPGGGGAEVEAGAARYAASCVACHGAEAEGIAGLGKALVPSEFITSMTDEELVAFIAVGRAADDPENTVGVAMPARGGNPSLTDEDLAAIVTWLRSQQ